MKKGLVISGLITLIVCVWLSGCNTNDNTKSENIITGNSLLGTWTGEKSSTFAAVPIIITELTFTSNSVYMTFKYSGLTTSSTYSGTYETQGSKLLLTIQTVYSFSFTYSVNGNKLYLDSTEFTKQ